MLAPIFDEAADKVSSEFPSSRVVLGKVDCDKESKLILFSSCFFLMLFIFISQHPLAQDFTFPSTLL